MNLSGSAFDLLIAFFGGLLASFTPCVYPLIPISAGYIGLHAAGSQARAFFLGLVYIAGLALVYSALGVLASLTGTLFGSISTHPATSIFVGAVFIVFGLAMYDLFQIPLPVLQGLSRRRRSGYAAAFFLGLSSGLVASPCITPVLGSILAYLAHRQNILYGAALLFSFALGMGLILVFAATFTAVLLRLPKAGRWMHYVKRAFALMLLAVGAYFIYAGIRRLLL